MQLAWRSTSQTGVALCPACEKPVSRWSFSGTYLPPDEWDVALRKGHTHHLQCPQATAMTEQRGGRGWHHLLFCAPFLLFVLWVGGQPAVGCGCAMPGGGGVHRAVLRGLC